MASVEKMDLVRPDLGDYNAASNLMFNEEIKKLINQGHTVYHFGFGQSPFPVIETAVQALKDHAEEKAYLPVQGIPELRQAICGFHSKFHGLHDLKPELVIVAPGSKELIYLLMNIFNGSVFLVSPTWTTYKPQAKLAGKNAIIIETDMNRDWKLTPELLEQAVRGHQGNKLLVFCNPDNPTGTCYSDSELLALSQAFRKHKVIVLCDEIYGGLHYEQNHKSLLKYYPEGAVLSSGMSKWASAGGWRLGYHVYPPELSPLLTAVKSAASHTYSCAPAPMQFAAAKTYSDHITCEEYMRHTSRILLQISQFCINELKSVGVDSVKSNSGYYIFPDFKVIKGALAKRGFTTGQQMCDVLLQEASVALMPGGPAYLRPELELTTRLCYVNFDGAVALNNSRKLGLDTPLPDNFVQEFCRPVYDGINALVAWVRSHLQPRSKQLPPPGE